MFNRADKVQYPTEYVKTRQQLLKGGPTIQTSPIQILTQTIREHGIGRLYTGGAAFCISNASKSGIRFLTFDFVRSKLSRDGSGKVSPLQNLVAGIAAGVAESVAVVTPGETIKTRIVDDRAGPKLYKSTSHAIKTILSAEGPSGLYRGVVPVTLKQSANAMVRFTSYNFLLESLRPMFDRAGASSITSVVTGAMAGVVTVYCTMPFDNIKTKLQSLDGRAAYSGSLDCVRKLVFTEGVRSLWKGTTPRLIRLSVSRYY
jgi:solute carrier family 25 citrate transporter 1